MAIIDIKLQKGETIDQVEEKLLKTLISKRELPDKFLRDLSVDMSIEFQKMHDTMMNEILSELPKLEKSIKPIGKLEKAEAYEKDKTAPVGAKHIFEGKEYVKNNDGQWVSSDGPNSSQYSAEQNESSIEYKVVNMWMIISNDMNNDINHIEENKDNTDVKWKYSIEHSTPEELIEFFKDSNVVINAKIGEIEDE